MYKAIEGAKQDGLISGISDANVSITAPQHVKTLLDDLESDGELLETLMCSNVEVALDTNGSGSGSVGSITVKITPTELAKCPRCWRFLSAEDGALCSRCDDVVASCG